MGCGGLVISFISFFLIAIYVGMIMLPIGILMSIVGIFIYFYMKKFDIPNEVLTNAVLPIVKIMREEMKPGDKLKLRLDLRGFLHKEKLLNQSEPFAKGAYHKIINYFYRDQWIDGEAILADGTKLNWSIFDFVRHSVKSKRTVRGKHKTKTKDAHRSLIQLQVAMHEKKYLLPPKLKQKGQEGTILTKKGDNYNWMSIRKTVKHPQGKTFAAPDFINAVASAYARAMPVRGKK